MWNLSTWPGLAPDTAVIRGIYVRFLQHLEFFSCRINGPQIGTEMDLNPCKHARRNFDVSY